MENEVFSIASFEFNKMMIDIQENGKSLKTISEVELSKIDSLWATMLKSRLDSQHNIFSNDVI